MYMSKNTWTEEEINILKDLYSNNESLEKIANKLNRTKKAVARKANNLQLSRSIMDKHNNKYKAPYQDYDWCYERYINRNMTHEQMAKEANTTLRTIQKWCSEKHRLNAHTFKYHKKLSDIQRQLIMFSLLGDGHIDKREKEPLFIVCHAENQKDYLYWKYDMLKDLCASEPTKYSGENKTFTSGGKAYQCKPFYRFGTRIIYDLIPIRKMNKIDIIKQLNEFGIAIHILDDGNRSNSNWYVCVAEFTQEEKNLYVNVCKSNFRLNCKTIKDDRYIEFDAPSSRKIDDIILSNIPNNLDIIQYKIIDKDICEPANYFYVHVDNEDIGLARYCKTNGIKYEQTKNMLVELGYVDIDESKLIRLVERSDLYNDKRVRELS